MAYKWTAQLVEPLAQLVVDVLTAPDEAAFDAATVLAIFTFAYVLIVALFATCCAGCFAVGQRRDAQQRDELHAWVCAGTGVPETGEEETGEAIDKSGRWLVLVVLLTVMTACVVAGAVILGQVERLLTEKFRSRLLMLSYRLGECVVSPWRLFLPRDS
jgi:hypothetical protein